MADIKECDIRLQDFYLQLKGVYEARYAARRLAVGSSYRSIKAQGDLYRQGRRGIVGESIVTNCDGLTNKSKHNFQPAKAFDVLIYFGGVVTWNDQFFNELGALAKTLSTFVDGKIKWGGDFKSFKDKPHFEVI